MLSLPSLDAHVAHAARQSAFAKVAQQHGAATQAPVGGEAQHVVEHLLLAGAHLDLDLAALALGAGAAVDRVLRDLLDALAVFGREEQHAVGLQAIASLSRHRVSKVQFASSDRKMTYSTPGLLVVRLEARGDGLVHDEAHVGLVDAHAEGDRGAHDQRLVGHPELLLAVALGHAELAVVKVGADAVALERLGQLLGVALRQAVHDAALAAVLVDEAHDGRGHVGLLGIHKVHEVAAEVGSLQAHGRLLELEVQENVGLRLRGGRGRGAQERQAREAIAQDAQFLHQ